MSSRPARLSVWPKHRRCFIICLMVFIVLILTAGGWYFLYNPRPVRFSPNISQPVSLTSEVAVHFNKPIDRRQLIPAIEPAIEGEWHYENMLIGGHLARSLRFTPNRPFDPAVDYQIKLIGITDILGISRPYTEILKFTTEQLPVVIRMEPGDGAIDIAPRATLTLTLDSPVDETAEFRFSLEPDVSITTTVTSDGRRYQLTPTKTWQQAALYKLKVERSFVARDRASRAVVARSEPSVVWQSQFQVAPPPNVSTLSPSGAAVLVDEPVRINFSEPMVLGSLAERFIISPEVKGRVELSSDRMSMIFKPENGYAFDTDYEVRLAAGAETEQGGFLPEDAVINFKTIGPVRIARTAPADGAAGISLNTAVRIEFDQAVDKASAERAISFLPALAGAINWEDQTAVFTPAAPLAYGTIYHLTVAEGVDSVNGLPSDQVFSSTFMTVQETVELAVALDYQDRALSCEAAALKMALAGRGVSVTENDIMSLIKVDKTARRGDVWGDPYSVFVGDINGRQNTTGYGVYWGPIAKAASHWRPAEAFTGWSVPQVTEAVAAGYPVIAWGVFGNGYEDDWQTSTGQHIDAWKGEHARTVIGFVGAEDSPTKLIINDPYAGRLVWTRAQFEADWAKFGNAGVVVR